MPVSSVYNLLALPNSLSKFVVCIRLYAIKGDGLGDLS
jgi:hypothetical protein